MLAPRHPQLWNQLLRLAQPQQHHHRLHLWNQVLQAARYHWSCWHHHRLQLREVNQPLVLRGAEEKVVAPVPHIRCGIREASNELFLPALSRSPCRCLDDAAHKGRSMGPTQCDYHRMLAPRRPQLWNQVLRLARAPLNCIFAFSSSSTLPMRTWSISSHELEDGNANAARLQETGATTAVCDGGCPRQDRLTNGRDRPPRTGATTAKKDVNF